MNDQNITVASIHFSGGRFDDNALDLNTLQELQTFQKIVLETAKFLWRLSNQSIEGLPEDFEMRNRLSMRRIETGSVAIPIEIKLNQSQLDLWDSNVKAIQDTVNFVHGTFQSVANNGLLPSGFPRSLLPSYMSLGSSLLGEEMLEFGPPEKAMAQATPKVRERLLALNHGSYEDEIDILARVYEVNLRNQRFRVESYYGTSTIIKFSNEQTTVVLRALDSQGERKIRIRGTGIFDADGTLKSVDNPEDISLDKGPVSFDPNAPTVEEKIAKFVSEIPQEEIDKLPHDLSERHDYYAHNVRNIKEEKE